MAEPPRRFWGIIMENRGFKLSLYVVLILLAAVPMIAISAFLLILGREQFTLVTTIIVVAINVVFIGLSILVAAIVAKPIRKVSHALDAIADGDLTAKEKPKSLLVETSALIDTQEILRAKLNAVMLETRNTSEELIGMIEEVSDDSSRASGDSHQINSAMEDLAQGATSMATSVQDLSSEVVEIDECVGDMESSIHQLNESSDAMKQANSDATEYMKKVGDASDSSVDAVNRISKQIETTNQAIEKIDEAVVAIISIASQTNLLALNASIEAARAGEAGSGFAVVAYEINNLSMQSNESAKEISEIVNDIKNQSKASVELAGKVKEIIEREQQYVDETNQKFELLNEEIGASVENIQIIGTKINALSEVKNKIATDVEDLSAVSQENAASNEEVSASLNGINEAINHISIGGGKMTEGALKLQEAVAYYKV